MKLKKLDTKSMKNDYLEKTDFADWLRDLREIPQAENLTLTGPLEKRLRDLFALEISPREALRFLERNYPEILTKP